MTCRLELAALVLWNLLTYSLPAHKEFRFLLPALCMLMPYCGKALEDLADRFKAQVLAEEASFLAASFYRAFILRHFVEAK